MQANISTNPISGKSFAIVLAVAIMIIGTFLYFIVLDNAKNAGINSKKNISEKNNSGVIILTNTKKEYNLITKGETKINYNSSSGIGES
jgi:hypothetical protein